MRCVRPNFGCCCMLVVAGACWRCGAVRCVLLGGVVEDIVSAVDLEVELPGDGAHRQGGAEKPESFSGDVDG